jgi:hypothetical protein
MKTYISFVCDEKISFLTLFPSLGFNSFKALRVRGLAILSLNSYVAYGIGRVENSGICAFALLPVPNFAGSKHS